jgi:hypothetical protein
MRVHIMHSGEGIEYSVCWSEHCVCGLEHRKVRVVRGALFVCLSCAFRDARRSITDL